MSSFDGIVLTFGQRPRCPACDHPLTGFVCSRCDRQEVDYEPSSTGKECTMPTSDTATTDETPRAMTTEEMLERFMDHLVQLKSVWLNEERSPTAEEKLDGFLHSILCIFDGVSAYLPAFDITPSPHPSDEQDAREHGENWWVAQCINKDEHLHHHDLLCTKRKETPMTTADPSSLPITDDDIGRAAESLNATEDLWAKIASMADPVITCPECGGTGTLAGGGSLGEIPCPTCDGERTVSHPVADELGRLALPDFKPVRRRLLAMGQALDTAKRAEYVNGTGGGNVEVPPRPTKGEIAMLEVEIAALKEKGRDHAMKQLESGQAGTRDRRALPARKPHVNLGSLGGGMDGDDDV